MQASDVISVKLHVNSADGRLIHIRRFGFRRTGRRGDLHELRAQIASGEGVEDARGVGPLKYTDEEGSLVTIISDDDLHEAVR